MWRGGAPGLRPTGAVRARCAVRPDAGPAVWLGAADEVPSGGAAGSHRTGLRLGCLAQARLARFPAGQSYRGGVGGCHLRLVVLAQPGAVR